MPGFSAGRHALHRNNKSKYFPKYIALRKAMRQNANLYTVGKSPHSARKQRMSDRKTHKSQLRKSNKLVATG
jgi:hypothetical protein